MRIGANISSLQAYNSMKQANSGLERASLRMSSGLKINSVKDDPAGLAIANKIRFQLHGTEQSSQNSSNAVSFIQTADGALNQMHDMLQRIRELSVQAANDTNETTDRDKMQDEINQLIQEISDIPQKTEYNKIRMLNGECDRITIATPANNIDVLRMSDTVALGDLNFTVNSLATPAVFASANPGTDPFAEPNFTDNLVGKTISINGVGIAIEAADTKATLLAKLAANEEVTIVAGGANNLVSTITTVEKGSKASITITGDAAVLAAFGLDGDPALSLASADMKATLTIPATGLGLTANASYKTEGNRITIVDINNVEICIDIKETATAPMTCNVLSKRGPLSIQVGANKDMGMYLTIPKINSRTLEIDKVSVMDSKSATESLNVCDKAIALLSAARSRLGAYQNRLEYTVANLDNSATNSAQSLSRVEDADMAKEMTEHAKKNVIYQAGIAMMAQANARPQQILQLLQ